MPRLEDSGECVLGLDHEWEYFLADAQQAARGEIGLPYYFCRNCKKTLFQGKVYGFSE